MRPKTTLFMLTSLDGKISTGETIDFDFDRDLSEIPGVSEGLHQYYDAEQCTDLWSFNTGVVMNKIGVNTKTERPSKSKVSFVLIDNKPHIEKQGVIYLCDWLENVIIYTTNDKHPAFSIKRDNLKVIYYPKPIAFDSVFEQLYNDFNIKDLTIQSGSTLNAQLLKLGLIDSIDLFIAPILVGGVSTPSLIGGSSLVNSSELTHLKTLTLNSVKVLENNYIRVKYHIN